MALNVLLVSHGSGLGGAERVMLELIEGLDPHLARPVVMVPEEGALASQLRHMRVPLVVQAAPWWLPFDSDPHPTYLFRRYWEDAPQLMAPTAAVIERHRIDVVYSCSSPILHGALAAHVTRRPHLQHMQDLLGWPHLGLHMPLGRSRVAYWLLGALSSIVVCVGRTIREDIGSAIPDRKCRIVPLGFRTPSSHAEPIALPGPQDAAARIGIVGVVDRRKGADIIGPLVRRVCRDVPGAHFYWAGGVADDVAARLTAEGSVDGVRHLHFLGYTDRVDAFMASVDFLLHPARNETFPRVLLECGLASRTVVATRCGGGQEIVRDRETGLLAEVDNVEGLAEAVVWLVNNPQRRDEYGRAARAVACQFDMRQYHAEMQRALIDASEAGPAIKGRLASRAVRTLLAAPGRVTPPLRRWAHGARP